MSDDLETKKIKTESDPVLNLDLLSEQTERDAWRTIQVHHIATVEKEKQELMEENEKLKKKLVKIEDMWSVASGHISSYLDSKNSFNQLCVSCMFNLTNKELWIFSRCMTCAVGDIQRYCCSKNAGLDSKRTCFQCHSVMICVGQKKFHTE